MTPSERGRLRAAIGPGADYYLARFERIERGGGQWAATWSWPAFFCSSGWFAYRRMGGHSLANFFLPAPFFLPIFFLFDGPPLRIVALGIYVVIAFVAIPMYANSLYYRHLAGRLARAAAAPEDPKARKRLRPPSWATGIEAVLTSVLAFLAPLILIVVPAAYADYTPRATVAAGIALSSQLKRPITEFYEDNKRLPAPHEAVQYRIEGGKYTRSVAYDAEKRMIVITIGEHGRLAGKHFAMRAEEKDGTLSWTCRTIDLDAKYLPAMCRD